MPSTARRRPIRTGRRWSASASADRHELLILVIATVRPHPGKVEAYEVATQSFMPWVREANPGILFYHSARARDEANTSRVVEAYADQAVMDRHVASDLLKVSFAGLQDCIADMEIALHDTVA